MKAPFLLVALLPLLFQNCISVSSFQSARTVKPGEWSGFGGISSQSVTFTKKSKDSTLEDDIEKIKVPVIEGGARWGLGESTDIGFKYTTPGSLGGEFKYMMSDPNNQDTAHAAGLGVTYASFSSGSGDDEYEYNIIDLTGSYFFTYDLSVSNSFHVSPRYILRNTTLTEPDGSDDKETNSFIGVNIGFNLSGFVVEAGGFTSTGDSEAVITQITIGYSGSHEVVNRGKVVAASSEPSAQPRRRRKKQKMENED